MWQIYHETPCIYHTLLFWCWLCLSSPYIDVLVHTVFHHTLKIQFTLYVYHHHHTLEFLSCKTLLLPFFLSWLQLFAWSWSSFEMYLLAVICCSLQTTGTNIQDEHVFMLAILLYTYNHVNKYNFHQAEPFILLNTTCFNQKLIIFRCLNKKKS